MSEIRARRLKKKLSQRELAEMLGVERSTVSKWENGDAIPRGAKLIALSDILKCKVDVLLRPWSEVKCSKA